MSEDKTYNGWSNYETWVVKLWMDNEEGTYNYWLESVEEAIERADKGNESWKDDLIRDLSDRLKDEHEEAQPEVTGVWADLLNAAMSEVDWREIATALVGDYLADHPEAAKTDAEPETES